MNPSWITIYLGLGAILLELIIGIETGFDLVLVGSALVIGGGVGVFAGNWLVGILVTALLTMSYIFFGRQIIKSKLKSHGRRSNVESVIGKTGKVEKAISPAKPGQVRINSELWRATAQSSIAKGTTVKVEDVSGVTLHVVQYS